MARATTNGAGLVFEFDHDEVAKVADGSLQLGGAGGIVTAALAAAGITAPAALVAGAISAYFGAQGWLIRNMDIGCGVYLTIPWPAIWFGLAGLVIPTTRPCGLGGPPPPDWATRDSGEFGTSDPVDLLVWHIRRGVVAADGVVFQLALAGATSGWRKQLNVPNGLGSSWNVDAQGQGGSGEISIWAHEADNGQVLTFRKAKWLGILFDVLQLGRLHNLHGGDQVRFTWMRDE